VVPVIPSLEVSLCMNRCEAGFWRKNGTRTTHLTTVVPVIPSLEVSLCMNRCEAGFWRKNGTRTSWTWLTTCCTISVVNSCDLFKDELYQ
jgi:hypothetical protein